MLLGAMLGFAPRPKNERRCLFVPVVAAAVAEVLFLGWELVLDKLCASSFSGGVGPSIASR